MIDAPKPSQFLKHDAVDEIATAYNLQFRDGGTLAADFNVEEFCSNILRKPVAWRAIHEPAGRLCLASITEEQITLNENHRAMFDSKPFLIRSSLGHEIGHQILRHFELFARDGLQQNLFGDDGETEMMFHDSSMVQLGLSYSEMKELRQTLAREASIDSESYDLLKKLDDKLEPIWMFRQAEQFSACFLIPKDRITERLSSGNDLSKWRTLYRLAQDFCVSVSMVKVRLEKLGKIKVHEDKTIEVLADGQASLNFH